MYCVILDLCHRHRNIVNLSSGKLDGILLFIEAINFSIIRLSLQMPPENEVYCASCVLVTNYGNTINFKIFRAGRDGSLQSN